MKIKINSRTCNVGVIAQPDLDAITAKHTAFDSFDALLNAAGGYRPSIYLGGKSKSDQIELVTLSVAYGAAQAERRDFRQVFYGDFEIEVPATQQEVA